MLGSLLHAVTWADAHGSDGTLAAHEIDHKPYIYTTVGFLVKSDEVGVSVSFEQGEDGKFRDITFVPRAIVLDEWSLGTLKKKSPRKAKAKPTQEPPQEPHPSPDIA